MQAATALMILGWRFAPFPPITNSMKQAKTKEPDAWYSKMMCRMTTKLTLMRYITVSHSSRCNPMSQMMDKKLNGGLC